ncbi:MAG: hypothetical protein BXU00_02530 [Candidatus Nanoclepta minutus]|uniref:Uncharacterized protein n=1 Tax=Candidatus Nanoclepta minutus TaxID=1940235 RepID=A0A397WQ18_9ARCH|nr:MAG: hypothetical protein BXU00_02530 [Candidatus Nanoclepta minutus]
MELDNLLNNVVRTVLEPTEEEKSYWNQTIQTTLGGAIQTGKSILESVFSGYSEKELKAIEKAVDYHYGSGYSNLLSAFVTNKSIGEAIADYRMQREVAEMVVRRILGGITSSVNPYAGDLISRGDRYQEVAANLIISGMTYYLKNNGVENPEKFVNAYVGYVGLFGNSLIKLYEGLREIYTPKGIKLKLPGLVKSITDFNKYIMYNNVKTVIDEILSKKEKEKKEEVKKEEKPSKEELGEEEKPPAPYIP